MYAADPFILFICIAPPQYYLRCCNHGASTYDENKTEKTKSFSPLTPATLAFIPGDALWGQSSTKVTAPVEEVLSFFWNTKARVRKTQDTKDITYLDEPNNHSRVEYLVKLLSPPLSSRYFCNEQLWCTNKEVVGEGSARFALFPKMLPQGFLHLQDGLVEAEVWGFVNISEVNANECSLELTQKINFGGRLPKIVTDFSIANNLRRVTFCQQHFQQLRALRDYDAKDGIAIGEACMLTPFKSEQEKSEFSRSASKYQVGKTFPVNS